MKQRAAAPGNHHARPATRCNGGAAPKHRALLVPSAPQSREAMKYLKCTWGEVGGEGAGTGQGRRYQDLTALCTGSGGVSSDRLCPTCNGAVTMATLPQPSSTACPSCLVKDTLCLGLWVPNTPPSPFSTHCGAVHSPLLVWLCRIRKDPLWLPGRSSNSSAFSRLIPSYSHLDGQWVLAELCRCGCLSRVAAPHALGMGTGGVVPQQSLWAAGRSIWPQSCAA